MAWQTIGHEWAVAFLKQGVAAGRVAHAYLFSGPPQIGKTQLAISLAQALNCQGDAPCGHCSSCLKTARGNHPDVRVVAPVRGETGRRMATESIKIDQIRALQREAVLAPYEGRYRIYIIRRADLSTLEAANSLLKTLEEPPSHVVLILTAVRPEDLPATVISRCQHLALRPAAIGVVAQALCERGLPPDQADLLAHLSGGRVGWALLAAAEPALLKQRQKDLDEFVELVSGDRMARLQFAARAGRDPQAARQQLEVWMALWRDLLLVCGRAEGHVANLDCVDELHYLAGQATLTQAWAGLDQFLATADQLEANVNVQLALEELLLKLPCWRVETARRPPV